MVICNLPTPWGPLQQRHTYTDGYDTHIVIISGGLSLVTITTEHTLKYTVSY
jgi:hypothetical protein